MWIISWEKPEFIDLLIVSNKFNILFLCFLTACLGTQAVWAQDAPPSLSQKKKIKRQDVFNLMRKNGKENAPVVKVKELKMRDVVQAKGKDRENKASPKMETPKKAENKEGSGETGKPVQAGKVNEKTKKTVTTGQLKKIKRRERGGEIIRDIRKIETTEKSPVPDEKIIQRAIEDLRDKSSNKRRAAEKKLLEFGPEALPQMIKAYKRLDLDLHLELTKIAIKIGRPGEEFFLAALVDPNNSIRWNAAKVLGNIGGEKSVEPLIKSLGDPIVRPTAVDSLGMLGDKRAIPPLRELLESEDEFVKMLVKRALVQLGVKIQLL